MKARLLLDRRIILAPGIFVEMVIWKLPRLAVGGRHDHKYRLALVANSICVLRYDNEAGKGDHIHRDRTERRYRFHDVDRLLADFMADVRNWISENSDA